MGRVFEKRKHKMFARYNKMSRTFTKIGKEIAIAVKAGGPDPDGNSRLRAIVANAKAANMPKANIDAAISRASSKQDKDFEEVVYEGKGPHGIVMVIETATDNPTRTVANLRSYFNKKGGQLMVSGSLDFMFERKGIFRIKNNNINLEELELELIDYGMEEMEDDGEGNLAISVPFTEFGAMQKALEDRNMTAISAEIEWIPGTTVPVSDTQADDISKLIERLEQDEDVSKVFHNMA